MPAGFAVSAENLKTVLRELSKVDPNLRKELRSEMKTRLEPEKNRLAAQIPSAAPLSGFAGRGANPPFKWSKPRGTVMTPLAKRSRKPGFYPVVSIRFRSSGRNAGFEIMELAGSKSSGLTSQGRAMIQNLNARYPMRGGLGRFVIPEWKNFQGDAEKIAKDILVKFADKVNRRLR